MSYSITLPVIGGTPVEGVSLDNEPIFVGSHGLDLWTEVNGQIIGFTAEREIKGFFEALDERNARIEARRSRYEARQDREVLTQSQRIVRAMERRAIKRYWDSVYGTGLGGARFDLCLKTKVRKGVNAANAKAQHQAHHQFLVSGFYSAVGDTMFTQDISFNEEEAFFTEAEANGVKGVTNAIRAALGTNMRSEGIVLTPKQAKRLRKKANRTDRVVTTPKARKPRRYHTPNIEVRVAMARAAKLVARRQRKVNVVNYMAMTRFLANIKVEIVIPTTRTGYEDEMSRLAQEWAAMLPAQDMIDYIKEVMS